MTKTLTEQWREGTLPDGEYYVKDWDGKIDWFVAQNKILWRDNNNPMYASERIEVLAPVPSYDHFSQLVKKVELLQEQLDEAKTENNNLLNDIVDLNLTIQHKEEQISEANKLILWCAGLSWTGDQREDIFDKYLAKWGVK